MDEEKAKEAWQALMGIIDDLNERVGELEMRNAAANQVLRALMVEYPASGRPKLAAQIRDLAKTFDDLALHSTMTDERRDEYGQAVEHFARLLEA